MPHRLAGLTAFLFAFLVPLPAGTLYSEAQARGLQAQVRRGFFATSNKCDPGRVTVWGYVFRDTDGDGRKDPGEPGASGVTMLAIAGGYDNGVYVHSTQLKLAVTSSGGYYVMPNIPAGSDHILVQPFQDGTQFYTSSWHTIISGSVNAGTRAFNLGLCPVGDLACEQG